MIKDRYSNLSNSKEDENKNKKIISDDAYAICETIEKGFEALRRELNK